MYPFHFYLFVSWALYCVLHSVMASVSFKRMMEKLLGNGYKYYRLSYSIFAAITLIMVLIYQFANETVLLFHPPVALFVISVPLVICGMVVMGICIRKYFMNLSGIDVLIKSKHEPVLEVNGLHEWVRHPLYSGTLLCIWSLFFCFPFLNNLIACSVVTAYTLIGISMEEKKLKLEFGDSYLTYAAEIPMLIPSFRKLLKN
jgi:protein-S-isoprenylcysteine O-methyltransferase Ste14